MIGPGINTETGDKRSFVSLGYKFEHSWSSLWIKTQKDYQEQHGKKKRCPKPQISNPDQQSWNKQSKMLFYILSCLQFFPVVKSVFAGWEGWRDREEVVFLREPLVTCPTSNFWEYLCSGRGHLECLCGQATLLAILSVGHFMPTTPGQQGMHGSRPHHWCCKYWPELSHLPSQLGCPTCQGHDWQAQQVEHMVSTLFWFA